MKETKHTPGPWRIEQTLEHNWIGKIGFDGKADEVVCYTDRAGLQTERLLKVDANARLIAAAPELLEVCKSAMQELWDSSHPSGDPDDPNNMESDAVVYRQLKAAITKATGGEA